MVTVHFLHRINYFSEIYLLEYLLNFAKQWSKLNKENLQTNLHFLLRQNIG